jgi:hypothetical protein
MAGEIWLGLQGSEVLLSPFGRTLSIGDIELSRTDRTASGRKVKDIITTKKKITISYSMIDGPELTILRDLYNLHSTLRIIIENGGINQVYTVMMEPINEDRILCIGDTLWGNVQVVMEEV